MLKLLLLSILLATVLLPAFAARATQARRALATLLVAMVAAEVGYGLFLYFIFPRLV